MNICSFFPNQTNSKSFPSGKIALGVLSVAATIALAILGGSTILNQAISPLRATLITGSGLCGLISIALFILAGRQAELYNQHQKEIADSYSLNEELKTYLVTAEMEPASEKVQEALNNLSDEELSNLLILYPQSVVKLWKKELISFKKLTSYLEIFFSTKRLFQSPGLMPAIKILIKHFHDTEYKDKPNVQTNDNIQKLVAAIFVNFNPKEDKKKVEVLNTLAEIFTELDASLKMSAYYSLFLERLIFSPSLKTDLKIKFFDTEITQNRMLWSLDCNWKFMHSVLLVKNPTVLHLCVKLKEPELLKWFVETGKVKPEVRSIINKKSPSEETVLEELSPLVFARTYFPYHSEAIEILAKFEKSGIKDLKN